MITTAFITLAFYIVSMLLGIFPDGAGFPDTIHTAAQALGGYLGVTDAILPVTTLGQTIAVVFSVELIIFGYKTLKNFATHIPFVGGKG